MATARRRSITTSGSCNSIPNRRSGRRACRGGQAARCNGSLLAPPPHLRQAIEFGQHHRDLRGGEVDNVEEVRAQIVQYRRLSEASAPGRPARRVRGDPARASSRRSAGPACGRAAERVPGAGRCVERHAADPAAALVVVEQSAQRGPAVAAGAGAHHRPGSAHR